jgi:Ca2+-binding RTX toxin-like protein
MTVAPIRVSQTLLIIDDRVPERHVLVEKLAPTFDVAILDRDRDGIAQISVLLQAHTTPISRLHLVTHGAPDRLFLGCTPLDLTTLPHYAAAIASWSEWLIDDAEIVLYGCNVAARSTALPAAIHALTGVRVAASSTPIGASDRGGNWDLDVRIGDHDHTWDDRDPVLFETATRRRYRSTLIDPTIFTDEPDNLALNEGISLREAIGLTPSDGTIELQAGTYLIEDLESGVTNDDDNKRGDFDIVGKTLTIRGAGEGETFIDAQQLDRIFHILEGATLILEGVTVRNGGDSDDVKVGGGIFNAGTLELSESSISGNVAEASEGGYGGGLYNRGTATLTQVTVSDNQSKSSGGGIENVGGSLVLVETTVSGNTTTGKGGGIANSYSYSYSYETYSYTPGIVSITNSTISGNQVSSDSGIPRGGGLFNDDISELSVINSTVSGNSLNFSGSEPSYTTTGGGAGLYAGVGSKTTLIHATIANNTSSIGRGGVFIDSYVEGNDSVFTLTNSIISGNSGEDFAVTDSDDIQFDIRGANIVPVSDGSLGSNILTIDPLLGPLANNGGTTQTHALLEGSPAIDTAIGSLAEATDQRGLDREILPDIGAFELLDIITILESAQSTKVLEGFSGVKVDPNDPESSDGVGDFYLITLNYEPSAEVTVNLAFDLERVTLTSDMLTFTPDDWEIPQLVFVGAVDDSENTGFRSSIIAHSSVSDDALYLIDDVGDVAVDIFDNDGSDGDVLTLLSKVIFGSDRNDIYTGSDDFDEIHGKDGIDLIFGRGGNDRLFGGDGGDGLSGGDGIDYVNGEAGDDFLSGGEGNDIMYGSLGNDIMSGDGGDDLMFGGEGDDEIIGSGGNDTLVGGFGNDVFTIDGQGSDLIADYQPLSDSLSLLIPDPIESLQISLSNGNTNILDSSGNLLVTLAGVSISSLNNLTILQG